MVAVYIDHSVLVTRASSLRQLFHCCCLFFVYHQKFYQMFYSLSAFSLSSYPLIFDHYLWQVSFAKSATKPEHTIRKTRFLRRKWEILTIRRKRQTECEGKISGIWDALLTDAQIKKNSCTEIFGVGRIASSIKYSIRHEKYTPQTNLNEMKWHDGKRSTTAVRKYHSR